jgi:hypothetical protein
MKTLAKMWATEIGLDFAAVPKSPNVTNDDALDRIGMSPMQTVWKDFACKSCVQPLIACRTGDDIHVSW